MSFMDASYLGQQAINNMNANNLANFNAGMANSQVGINNALLAGQYDPFAAQGGFGAQTDYYSGLGAAYTGATGGNIYGGGGGGGSSGTGTPDTAEQPFSPSGGVGGYSPPAYQPAPGMASGIDPMTGETIFSGGTAGLNDMGMPPDYGQPGGGGSSFADRFNAAPQPMQDWHPQSYDELPQAITSGVQPSTDFGRVPDNFNSRFAPLAGESAYTPQDFPGWTPPERRGMAIGIDPMTGETIFSGGAMNSMNAMPGGVPTPQPRPVDAPSDFSSRYQFQTPTPQERPAEAPPMTTQNPVADRWDPIYGDGSGGYGPGDRSAQDQMRDAIAQQIMRANDQSWTYTGTSPNWGTRQTQTPDTFTSYPYNDTLTPNNTVQYRTPQVGDPSAMLQKFLDDMDRATANQELGTLGPDQTYDPLNTLRPSDYTTPYQPGG